MFVTTSVQCLHHRKRFDGTFNYEVYDRIGQIFRRNKWSKQYILNWQSKEFVRVLEKYGDYQEIPKNSEKCQ